MKDLLAYYQQTSDLRPAGIVPILDAGIGDDPQALLERLEAREPQPLPPGVAAALAHELAATTSDSSLQARAITLYLSTHFTEVLASDCPACHSLTDLLAAATTCKVPQQRRDLSIAMARLLLVDERWYLLFSKPADKLLEFMQGEWSRFLPDAQRPTKKRAIGHVASSLRALLSDSTAQYDLTVKQITEHLREGRLTQLDTSLEQAQKLLTADFQLLLRSELPLAQQSQRLWSDIRNQVRARRGETTISPGPIDARELLQDVEKLTSEILSRAEFALRHLCLPIQASLHARLSEELRLWGAAVPSVDIVPERISYPFPNSTSEILLLLKNTGALSIDRAVVVLLTTEGVNLSPSTYEVRDLDPGEVVREGILTSVPPDAARLEISWLADLHAGSTGSAENEGKFTVQIDRGTPWTKVEVSANPFPTVPIESADRLFGRDDILKDLRRVVNSGESRYLTGQRRVGKTSVARVLLESLDKQQFIPVYAPWGEIGGMTLGAVCRNLCIKLRDEAIIVQPDLPPLDLSSLDEFERGFNQATVGFIRRVRTVSRRSIVIVLDDFDDVPAWVYSGEAGDLFFSMVKTLTGSSGISILFVGGQRLQKIMRSPVASKLNQVTPVDLGYLSPEAMRDLVEGPAKGVLRFDEAAVDRITWWSACNPFYANRICNQLWNFLIRNTWTNVLADDVDRIVNEVASRDDSPLFSHFWRDGIWGEVETHEAAVTSNMLLLYAFGRVASSNADARYFDIKDLQRSCPYLPQEDQKKWLDDLVTREIIERHPDLQNHYAVRIPYFQLWLSKRGASEIYSSLDPSILMRVEKPEQEAVTDEDLEALIGQGIKYRSGKVTVYEVRKFLRQFTSGDNQRIAYKLLQKLVRDGFYNEDHVREAAEAAISALSRYATAKVPGFTQQISNSGVWQNLFVAVPSSSTISSFQVLADVVRQQANLGKWQVGSCADLPNYVRSQRLPVAVLLFDDVVGTGQTAYEALREVLAVVDKEGIEAMVACVLFSAVVGFHDVEVQINAQLEDRARIHLYRKLMESDEAFHPSAKIFDSDEEREQARKLIESIGRQLEPKWPLGYGGRQALVSFYRNTPNVTLPIFYKSSTKKSLPWTPLFRRM